MATKKSVWRSVFMILYWAIYLTATMALFEYFNILPGAVPFGIFGWFLFVEVPRVIVGFFVSMLFFRIKQ
jgi:hypothetical protein